MSRSFAVVHEAVADFTTATELADRVLIEAIDWMEEDQLPYQRDWVGETADGRRLSWTEIKHLARASGVRSHGHFDGEPGLPDAIAARRAIDYLQLTFPELGAIVLLRDQDDGPERRAGLDQARSQVQTGIAVVVGFAIVERECWVVCGFEPQDESERGRLEGVRQQVGFHPHERSHDLKACKDDSAKLSPKRVLRVLTDGNYDRERRCWKETSLDVLRQRGKENGLADYLHEVRERLGPLIGHVSLS
jgi:hypothetical protein